MLRQRRKRLLIGPRLPPKVIPKAAAVPPKATQNERQFQGPVTAPPTAPTAPTAPQTVVTAPTTPMVPTTKQPIWNPGNARTMPPPPTITAFRPPIRTRPMMAGPMMAGTSESTRIPSEDRVEQWTELQQPSPVKQSRANRATFMFAALLLIIVAVSYIVRKRNRSALYGGGGYSVGYGSGDGGYATW